MRRIYPPVDKVPKPREGAEKRKEEPNRMERKWRLGEDLDRGDNLLDEITFSEVITTVHCNCKIVTEDAIRNEVKHILEIRMQDMKYLLENNIDVIAEEAMKGRH